MIQINPYLIFNGNCAEAMTFYKQCFGGVLTIQFIGESPIAKEWPDNMQNHVLHATLKQESILLLASDLAGPEGSVQGNTVSLSVFCSNENDFNTIFEKLSMGGTVVHPVHEFYAGKLGTVKDKFGMTWLLKL